MPLRAHVLRGKNAYAFSKPYVWFVSLAEMSDTIHIMVDKTVGINENISSQSAAMEEINASIEELSAMAETISQISRGMTD